MLHKFMQSRSARISGNELLAFVKNLCQSPGVLYAVAHSYARLLLLSVCAISLRSIICAGLRQVGSFIIL